MTTARLWDQVAHLLQLAEGKEAVIGRTGHGTSSYLLVISDKVKGGLRGCFPSLADLERRDDPKVHVDHRRVYASILEGRLGGDTSMIIYSSGFADFGLFKRLGANT